MGRAGSSRRVLMVAAVLVSVLSACDWTSFGFDAGNSRSNGAENAVGVGNVGGLAERWRSTVLTGAGAIRGTPAVANGLLFTQSGGSSGYGRLTAYDAVGATGCAGTPKVCTPRWQSSNVLPSSYNDPTVVAGKVYAGAQQSLQVYDAAGGSATCGGTPRTCAPLWSTYLGGYSTTYGPVVANGVVFATVGPEVRVYDTATSVGCSGTPVVCPPVRVYRPAGSNFGAYATRPVVVDGTLYVGGGGGLYAFDATGATGCAGTPVVCGQLWSAPTGVYQGSSPLVSGGRVYTHVYNDELAVFDAKGVTGCGGSPKTCGPLWRTSGVKNGYASPALAKGRLFVASSSGTLGAFDATGVEGCSGTPRVCSPLWKASIPVTTTVHSSSPAVANGLVFVGSNGDRLYAFDATGTAGCSGAPKVCSAVWTGPTTGGAIFSSPIVANGVVYVGSDSGRVHAYGL
jgi:hypothetical protein